MTTNFERRIEALEAALGEGGEADPSEVQAYIKERFSRPYEPVDVHDKHLFDGLEERYANIPAIRRLIDLSGWPQWNGERWHWPEYQESPDDSMPVGKLP